MSKRMHFLKIHLLLSLFATLLVISIFYTWFPAPLAKAAGVMPIITMVIVINMLMGPMLAFMVYKEGKKSLKFDLSVIIAIQVLALCYGVFSIAQGRPAWLIYSVDRFELVRNNEINTSHIQQTQAQFQSPSWFKPQYAAMQFAKDPKQRNEDMFAEIFSGIAVSQRPERYVPLKQATTQMQQRAQSLSLLEQFNAKGQVKKVLQEYPQANAYLPLKANAVDMTVLINKDTVEIIKIVDLRPWK